MGDLLKQNKKILIVSFAFPPISGSGVQRVVKFAKYLPKFGWEPIILTVKSAIFSAYRLSPLDELNKGIKIFRTYFIDFLKIKKKIAGEGTIMPSYDSGYKAAKIQKKSGLLNFFLKFFNQYFLVPDDKIGWIPFAVKEGLKIIKEENIDLIYTTGDPFSVFIIGYLLKKFTGKKWIVDYRDSWTDFSLYGPFRGNLRKKTEVFLEYHILKNVDKIISVSPLINEKLQSRYHRINKNKYEFLSNGYDVNDFYEIKKERVKDCRFVITYTGIFDGMRSPEMFLIALKELLNKNNELKNNVEVRFIGVSLNENINEMIEKHNLKNIVKFLGYKEHEECIKEIVNADVLLLIQNYNNLEAYSGKIFEYLHTGNPILGIVPPEGCAGKLIRETNAGIVIKENNVEEIKKAIKELYYNRGTNPDREKINEYSRYKLTEKLVLILNGI